MLLTYVILTYNQKEYIRAALASALAQTYAPLEILVADD
ncbi:MAG: glycosyltransferase family 2 protein, partial [Victivallales bacterium]|nr:glycosyltransferase family 2 protein [Victivallales bacterium]